MSRLTAAVVIGLLGLASPALIPAQIKLQGLGSLDSWKVGDKGTCGYTPRIFKVYPPDRVLLGSKSDGPLVILKVSDVAGLEEGLQFSFGSDIVHVTGKQKT